MNRFKVVLVANDNHPIPDWVAEKFSKEGIQYEHHQCYNREDLEKYASDADVLWFMSSRRGLVVEENMDIFNKTGVMIKCGSGTDNIDHEACKKRGIIVAHTPDDPTEPTSDHFIAMLFTAVRQTARQDRLVRSGIWDVHEALPIGPLTGADVGIIGFGRISRAIVRKLSGFNMNMRIFDPYVDEAVIKESGACKVCLDELLKKSRYVLVACPLTKETENLIGERELKTMRGDSILVNVSRAGIVNEEALIKALKENWIMAAAFDVLKKHPLKPEDEFLKLENINFTPHLGGYPYNYPDGIYETVIDEIIMMSKMQMPRWIVNKGVKPKWDKGG
ncbi:MAG: NAD(P)-dependent oxidoreductase [Clostridiales bacterium]|nr:NAD(P)-dependent oxidoreductase [Clostridiales bacterium]